MVLQQKIAWINIVIVAAASVLFIVLATTINVLTGMASMSLFALLAFEPLYYRRARKRGEVVSDERDRFISRRANLFGFGASYLAFVLANMIPWIVVCLVQGKEEVSIHLMVMPVLVGWGVAVAGTSIATLVFYGREDSDATE